MDLKAKRFAVMNTEAQEEEERKWRSYLESDKSVLREELLSLKESMPSVWEAHGGDKLLDCSMPWREADVYSLRILRLMHESGDVLTKSAAGGAASATIPPDTHAVAFPGRSRLALIHAPAKSQMAIVALNPLRVLQRVFLNVAFPSEGHRRGLLRDAPKAGAVRLAMAASVCRAWRAALSGDCDTAWEVASRLRWPHLPAKLTLGNWRSLYRSRILAGGFSSDETAIENCHAIVAPLHASQKTPGADWQFLCPMAASEIETISSSLLFCSVCRKSVHVTQDEQEIANHALHGRCVSTRIPAQ